MASQRQTGALPRALSRVVSFCPLWPRRCLVAVGYIRILVPIVSPPAWRAMRYWRKLVPIITRYLLVKARADRCRRNGDTVAADLLWEQQHETGAAELRDMLVELKGFYLKLGQILAAKTDMLPKQYTTTLQTLLSSMPEEPLRSIQSTLRNDLRTPFHQVRCRQPITYAHFSTHWMFMYVNE